jgi:hypothetical protein
MENVNLKDEVLDLIMKNKNFEYIYAWADSIKAPFGEINLLSHTWVTTYSPGNGEPDLSKGHYWYCWGVPHNNAEEVAKGQGGIDFACRIAVPNDRKADVGIRWGKDGFCHQMANRLLRFSTDNKGNPVTVSKAKGYMITHAAHGVYGGKHTPECQEKWDSIVKAYEEGSDD